MCLLPVWHNCSTVSADEFMKHLQGWRKEMHRDIDKSLIHMVR